jgi:hypothetical protein
MDLYVAPARAKGNFFADKMPNHWRVGFENGNSLPFYSLPDKVFCNIKRAQQLLPVLAAGALCHLQPLELSSCRQKNHPSPGPLTDMISYHSIIMRIGVICTGPNSIFENCL